MQAKGPQAPSRSLDGAIHGSPNSELIVNHDGGVGWMQSWPGVGVGGVPGNGRGAAALIPLVPLGTNQGLGPLRPRLNDQGLCLGPDTGHVWGLRGLGSRESPCLSGEHSCLFSWERLQRGKEGMGEMRPMMKRKTKSAKQTNKQTNAQKGEGKGSVSSTREKPQNTRWLCPST